MDSARGSSSLRQKNPSNADARAGFLFFLLPLPWFLKDTVDVRDICYPSAKIWTVDGFLVGFAFFLVWNLDALIFLRSGMIR